MGVLLTIETLAAEPRWELARTLALPGRSRGDLLGGWGENVTARFGPDALAAVRRRLVHPLDRTAAVLTSRDWVPVHAQLLVTEAIVDELLHGDLTALGPLLVEDTRAGMGRVQLGLLKALGAERAFRLGPRTFKKVHERGTHDMDVERRRARASFRGTPLFEHPTWRILQLFAMRTLLELTGHAGTVVGEDGGPDHFIALATW